MKEGDYVFVYGSLRNGCYNHSMMKNFKFVGNATANGFKLHSLGVYPAIRHSNDLDNDIIIGEIYQITKESMQDASRIHGMELGAGYVDEEISTFLDKKEIKAIAYIYSGRLLEDSIVESGDWVNHI